MTAKTVKHIIRQLVQAEGKTPYQINNGGCQSFADELAASLKGAQVGETDPDWFYSDPVGAPSHAFVKYKGKHYDAEAPLDVDDPKALPIFKRAKIRHLEIIRTT